MEEAQVVSDAQVASNVTGDAGTLSISRPYPPSWGDRFIGWVSRLPFPAWVFYTGLGLVMIAVETAVKWNDGVYAGDGFGTYFPFHLVLAGTIAYVLGAWHIIKETAGAAISTFRPALYGGERDFERFHYELTISPARQTLLASLVGTIFGTVVWFASFLPASLTGFAGDALSRYLGLATSPVSGVLDYLLDTGVLALTATVCYNAIRVVRLVNHIYTQQANIDILKIDPLYALSGLTARIAIVFIIGVYPWYLANPVRNVPSSLWAVAQLSTALSEGLLATVAFIWPLLGAHRLLDTQKERLLSVNSQQMTVAATETSRLLNLKEYGDMGSLNSAVNTLVAERGMLSGLRTWPWQYETVRTVGTAIFLPLVIYLAQRALSLFVG
jgi:hypothetical protein